MMNRLNHLAYFVKVVGACVFIVSGNKYRDKETNVNNSITQETGQSHGARVV